MQIAKVSSRRAKKWGRKANVSDLAAPRTVEKAKVSVLCRPKGVESANVSHLQVPGYWERLTLAPVTSEGCLRVNGDVGACLGGRLELG